MDQVCCSDKYTERWEFNMEMFFLAAETRPLFGHALLQPSDRMFDGAESHNLIKLKPQIHSMSCL